jgi:hypothetical protein
MNTHFTGRMAEFAQIASGARFAILFSIRRVEHWQIANWFSDCSEN